MRYLDFGTAQRATPPAGTFDQRIGRCFELAALAVCELGPGPWRLVHGGWFHGAHSVNGWIGHAWVRNSKTGHVWEPILAILRTPEEWADYVKSDPEVEYDYEEVMRLFRYTEHYGSWHVSKYPSNPSKNRPGRQFARA